MTTRKTYTELQRQAADRLARARDGRATEEQTAAKLDAHHRAIQIRRWREEQTGRPQPVSPDELSDAALTEMLFTAIDQEPAILHPKGVDPDFDTLIETLDPGTPVHFPELDQPTDRDRWNR